MADRIRSTHGLKERPEHRAEVEAARREQAKRRGRQIVDEECRICGTLVTASKVDQRIGLNSPESVEGYPLPDFLLPLCTTHLEMMDEWVSIPVVQARTDHLLEQRRGPYDSATMFVYFFQRRDRLIKIGASANVLSRKAQLETGSGPLTLLGVERGGFPRERELHQRFGDSREAGEWFHPTDALIDYLKSIAHGSRVILAGIDRL